MSMPQKITHKNVENYVYTRRNTEIYYDILKRTQDIVNELKLIANENGKLILIVFLYYLYTIIYVSK